MEKIQMPIAQNVVLYHKYQPAINPHTWIIDLRTA